MGWDDFLIEFWVLIKNYFFMLGGLSVVRKYYEEGFCGCCENRMMRKRVLGLAL